MVLCPLCPLHPQFAQWMLSAGEARGCADLFHFTLQFIRSVSVSAACKTVISSGKTILHKTSLKLAQPWSWKPSLISPSTLWTWLFHTVSGHNSLFPSPLPVNVHFCSKPRQEGRQAGTHACICTQSSTVAPSKPPIWATGKKTLICKRLRLFSFSAVHRVSGDGSRTVHVAGCQQLRSCRLPTSTFTAQHKQRYIGTLPCFGTAVVSNTCIQDRLDKPVWARRPSTRRLKWTLEADFWGQAGSVPCLGNILTPRHQDVFLAGVLLGRRKRTSKPWLAATGEPSPFRFCSFFFPPVLCVVCRQCLCL